VPVIPWQCAHGEAPAVTLPCGLTVAIAPHDDSVDSNAVLIKGGGLITSFGDGPRVLKRVMFEPGVELAHNPPALSLLCCRNRVITTAAVGTYASDGDGHWSEVHFSATGSAELSRRLETLVLRLAALERQS
jgi:hypothetical protein